MVASIFRPESASAFSEYAGGLAAVVEVPLQKGQELLARIYGYANAHELRNSLRNPGSTRYEGENPEVDAARLERLRSEIERLDKPYSWPMGIAAILWRLERLGLFRPLVEYRSLRERAERSCEVARQELADEHGYGGDVWLAFELGETYDDCLWVLVDSSPHDENRGPQLFAYIERSRWPGSWKHYSVNEGLWRLDCPLEMLELIQFQPGSIAAAWACDVRLRATPAHRARVAALRPGMALAVNEEATRPESGLAGIREVLVAHVDELDVAVEVAGRRWPLPPSDLQHATIIAGGRTLATLNNFPSAGYFRREI